VTSWQRGLAITGSNPLRNLHCAWLVAALVSLNQAAKAADAWSPECEQCAATFDIRGQPLHIEKQGNHGPVVVFEAGLGADISAWRDVVGPISAFAQATLYDRAGLGSSTPLVEPGRPITARSVATALDQLLTQAGLHPPFILVGHSLGGLYVQMFARLHPEAVAGMVLLDSSSADAPAALKTRARLVPGSTDFLEEEGVAESNRQVRSAGPFPPIPLTVIAATDHGPYFRQWEPTLMHLQEQLATLSPLGTLIIAQGSGHDIAVDRPAQVIAAVRAMVDALTRSSLGTAGRHPID
jgi:pimeloyl-ACP methyl ester carboxylesterase